MNILFLHQHITPISPFEPMAGGAAAMLDLAEALHGAGTSVTIAGILPEGKDYSHRGISYHNLGRDYDLDRHLSRLEDRRFDAVHAQRGYALAKAARHFPSAVKTLHAIDIFFNQHRISPATLNRTAHAIIAVSRFVKGELIGWGVNEEIIAVIYNGLRTDLFRQRPEIARQDKLVVFAGATVPVKGIVVLLKAIDLLMRQDPNLRLEVYGSAALWGKKGEYVDWTGVSKMRPNIVYKGACPQEDLARAFSRASLCVVPTDPSKVQEGFCAVSLEAQACGCPVVVSRSGGLPETMMDGRTGVIVDPLNERNLALAIKGLLADKARREDMSRRAAEHAKRLTLEATARRFLVVVEQARRPAAS